MRHGHRGQGYQQQRSASGRHDQGFSQGLPGPPGSLTSRCRAGKRRPALRRAMYIAVLRRRIGYARVSAAGCDCDPGRAPAALPSFRANSMQSSLGKFADRWAQTSFALCVLYSIACALALATGWGGTATAEYIGAWGTFPVEIAAALMLWPVITDDQLTRAPPPGLSPDLRRIDARPGGQRRLGLQRAHRRTSRSAHGPMCSIFSTTRWRRWPAGCCTSISAAGSTPRAR